MNDSVKSTIVLTAICLVVTVLLSAVNYVTAPIIKENSNKAVQESLKSVLPEADSFESVELTADVPATVTAVYRDTAGTGYAVTIETTSQYSEAPMAITAGIGTDGIIKNIVLTNYSETKDFGADYPATYIGQDSALSGVDIVAGVTYSSTAFKNAVTDAFTALFAVGDVAEGEKSDAQMASEAIGELLPACLNNVGACDVTEENGLFVSSNNAGYAIVSDKVAYVSDAFGNFIGSKSFSDEAAADDGKVSELTKAVTDAYVKAGEKAVERIVKMYEDAEVTALTINVQSTVNGAYSFESAGTKYYAFTASSFGYGGVMSLMYVVNENGEVAKFKVISHNETEYYGEAVAESEYAGRFNGAVLSSIGDDVTTIAGCTFTSNGVKTALTDVTAAFNAVKEAQ